MTVIIDRLQEAVTDTLEILSDTEDRGVFGNDLKVVDKTVKQIAWKAKKLKKSQQRNAAVSVYGPSQVGKSFLASVLVRPSDGYLQIDFPDPVGSKTYIDEINPGGDQECTGIVTRFTIDECPGDKEFPVYVRLLSEIDLICILCNTYFSEGDQKYENHRHSEEIKSYLGAISGSGENKHLSAEDFWELEEYLREHFSTYDYVNTILPFVEEIGEKALNATPEDRAKLYAPLWGFHKPFTDLFIKLVQALAALDYSPDATCEISALIPKSNSIIDVRLLGEISSDESVEVSVKTGDESVSKITRGLLSGLTAELVLKISGAPHDFFNYTDALDFPGTRNRKPENLTTMFQPSDAVVNIHQFFLRGKVAYLFDKYVTAQDINSMLLCIKDSNMEAVGLPAMIEKWVHNSIGPSPADRFDKDNNLFFVLTYFDKHLTDTAANRNETDRFTRRMNSSVLEMFGNHENTWVKNWDGKNGHPKAFKNCFLLRNPGVDQSFFTIDAETGIESYSASKNEENRLNAIKEMFIQTPEVIAHFNDPHTAWNEVIKPNDGGTSYILENLAKVSRNDTKITQLNSLAGNLTKDLSSILTEYYVPTDISEKERVANEKFEKLKKEVLEIADVLTKQKFSKFLEKLSVTDELLLARFSGENAHSLVDLIGNVSQIWVEANKSSITQVSKEFKFNKSLLEFLVHEMSISMEASQLNQTIYDRVEFLEAQGITRGVKSLVAEIAAKVINSFVCETHMDIVSDSESLELKKLRPNIQREFAEGWLEALRLKIKHNVEFDGGNAVNVRANAKIEKILSLVSND